MKNLMKFQRRVLVQFMSGHLHMECVEVLADVWNPKPDQFLGELVEIERAARALLAERVGDGYGPWREQPKDFDIVGILCATLRGLDAGRITWVAEVPTEQVAAPEKALA